MFVSFRPPWANCRCEYKWQYTPPMNHDIGWKNVRKFCWRFCHLRIFPDEDSKKLKSIAWGFLRKSTFNTMHSGNILEIVILSKNVQKFCWRFCFLQIIPDEDLKKLKSIAWNTFNTMQCTVHCSDIFLEIMLCLLTRKFNQKMFNVKVFQYKISNRMIF